MTKGDIYKLFTEQVMKQHEKAVFTYEGGGGCESCGLGGEVQECVACGAEGKSIHDHRPGCSVPLILAEQHEAGLHNE